CALVAMVCNFPAAHKIAGLAMFTHSQFCSQCKCTRQVHGYGNTDYQNWAYHTGVECQEHADIYTFCKTKEQKKDVFCSTGLCWSELLHLKYFNITQFVVVDTMHNLFLGLIKEHFKGVLGL
ncbi:hypothetical protein ARMGADRAFT_892202, partial [Armillaria gallica]